MNKSRPVADVTCRDLCGRISLSRRFRRVVVVRQLESELCVVNDREKEQPLINSVDQKRFNKSTIRLYTFHSLIHSFTRFDSDVYCHRKRSGKLNYPREATGIAFKWVQFSINSSLFILRQTGKSALKIIVITEIITTKIIRFLLLLSAIHLDWNCLI